MWNLQVPFLAGDPGAALVGVSVPAVGLGAEFLDDRPCEYRHEFPYLQLPFLLNSLHNLRPAGLLDLLYERDLDRSLERGVVLVLFR